MFHTLSIQIMQFLSLPEQSSPNRPLEHWQFPLIPQIPWPLHVELGLQNANTNIKSVKLLVSKLSRLKFVLITWTISWEELTVTITSTIISAGSVTATIGCSFTCNYHLWKKVEAVTNLRFFGQLSPGGGGLVASLFWKSSLESNILYFIKKLIISAKIWD